MRSMLSPNKSPVPASSLSAGRGLLGLCVGLPAVCLIAASHTLPVSAQSSPGGFTLPEPTPTPTPAPQGPVDVRSGVPIGPRSIPQNQEQPVAPSAQEQEQPAIDVEFEQDQNTSAVEPASQTPTPAPSPALSSAAAQANQTPTNPTAQIAPGSEQVSTNTQTEPPFASGETTDGPPPASAASAIPTSAPTILDADTANAPEQSTLFVGWVWALIALILALGFGLAAFVMRQRKARSVPAVPVLARETLGESTLPPSPTGEFERKDPAAPQTARAQTTKPPEPARIDTELEIVSASRSLMMITLDCRLTFFNRADTAARDLTVSGSLVCAQRSATAGAAADAALQKETIERIGPQQSQMVEMQLQLPLSAIQPIRQGKTPLCIPLAQLAIELGDAQLKSRSFVIGTPSQTSANRLHPIPLDTPPGSIKGLLAHEVKTDGAAARAA
ncbi:MAG: hypothetical protein AAGL10_12015 [Pseudomonadota bacterium]